MPMLHRCSHEDCSTLTLGKYCLEHEPHAPRTFDGCHRDTPEFAARLHAAQGFRVVGPNGRIGRVAGHVVGRDGRVSALTVTTGLFRRVEVELPVSDVEWVLPFGRRLLVSRDVQLQA